LGQRQETFSNGDSYEVGSLMIAIQARFFTGIKPDGTICLSEMAATLNSQGQLLVRWFCGFEPVFRLIPDAIEIMDLQMMA